MRCVVKETNSPGSGGLGGDKEDTNQYHRDQMGKEMAWL